ncbi:hypothetical protein [Halobaculum lipolyticum]|uniref:DoxX family membrane protein n=1 Tax=Halobaculum lipolyticum TaxID=3032001 RepID=A0ABD5WDB4_9EURY|nr:hypothetical protein [Halobaculum sp. DT31]
MLRKVFTAICTVEVVAPEALIEGAEQIALDNPDECELRPWVIPGARVEGLILLALLWYSDGSYSLFKRFLGLLGLLVFAFPRAYVDYGDRLAYTTESTPEWKPWVYRGTRLVGAVYLLIAINELRRARE